MKQCFENSEGNLFPIFHLIHSQMINCEHKMKTLPDMREAKNMFSHQLFLRKPLGKVFHQNEVRTKKSMESRMHVSNRGEW